MPYSEVPIFYKEQQWFEVEGVQDLIVVQPNDDDDADGIVDDQIAMENMILEDLLQTDDEMPSDSQVEEGEEETITSDSDGEEECTCGTCEMDIAEAEEQQLFDVSPVHSPLQSLQPRRLFSDDEDVVSGEEEE